MRAETGANAHVRARFPAFCETQPLPLRENAFAARKQCYNPRRGYCGIEERVISSALLKSVCVALLLALLCTGTVRPAALAEAGGGAEGIDAILAEMSTRDKLAQMMFFSPRTWKDDPESA